MLEKQVKISEIKRNPANPRVIRDEKYTKLLNSLLVFPKMLKARPIVVDKQMVVLGGNMRLKALQEIATFDNDELYARLQKINEWKEKDKSEQTEIFDFWLDFATTKKLNVAVADDFTDKEASAFIIKDNNNFGEWDYDLLNNWDSELLEDWGIDVDFAIEEEETQIEEDEAPEEVETRCKLGDIWQLGEHRLICGDSTDISVIDRLMDGVKADMVMTDPPYGINAEKMTMGTGAKEFYRGEDWDSKRPDISLALTLADNVCIWGGNYFADILPVSNDWLVWHKKNDGLSFSECELAWTNFGRNVRHISHHWGNEKKLHVTMKPVSVIAWAIQQAKDKAEIIVDIFGGSGSTLIACEQLNRKCYMAELDPHYCDVILQRWENFTNKKATKIK